MATRFIEEVDPTSDQSISTIVTALKNMVARGAVPLISDGDTGLLHTYDRANSAVRTLVNTDQAQTLTGKTVAGPKPSEVVTAANVITAAESGTTFYLDLAVGFLSTLPAPALGLNYTFIVKTAPTGGSGYTIGTPTANIIFGSAVARDGAAGVAGASEDLITLVNDAAIIGDRVFVESDGTNWYVVAQVDVAAGITMSAT